MNLFVTGINHRTVSLPGRERYGLTSDHIRHLLPEIQLCPPVQEAVLLSTCNRMEVYAVAARRASSPRAIFGHVLRMAWPDMPRDDFARLQQGAYLFEGEDCVRHLFRVTSGLDSLILGETEITGQVRAAYQTSLHAGTTGTFLNVLFQKALAASKKVRNRSDFERRSVSFGAMTGAVVNDEMAKKPGTQNILVVGAGQMARSVLHQLHRPALGQLWLANRSPKKGRDLANRLGAESVPIAQCRQLLSRCDVLISAASSSTPLFDTADLQAAMSSRPPRNLLVLDLGVPRNVAPAAGGLPGVRVVNVEDLGEIIQRMRNERRPEAPLAEYMVARGAARVAANLQARHEQSTRASMGSCREGARV